MLIGAVACALTCGGRQTSADFSDEVDRICDNFCEMNLRCHEPPLFADESECHEVCVGQAYVMNDTDCGAAQRAQLDCVGHTQTCAAYNDTNNVDAETYTCQTETLAFVTICGSSDEQP